MKRQQHLFGAGPKHILSLDGGGVRGVLTLAYLERVEALLAEHHGRGDDFRLADHFALIGGTSTGSIIASALALGHSVADILDVYRRLARRAFGKKRLLGGLITPKFDAEPLIESIRSRVGDVKLGSDEVLTGLGIVAKRLDTNSVWLFHNHPNGPYFNASEGQVTYTANRDLKLLNLIRASTAAPTYFEPEFISIADGVNGTFVDGGVSPHNNPSFALFMLASLKGYGFSWPTGPDNLHVLSVGTGVVLPQHQDAFSSRTSAAMVGISAMKSLMSDCEGMVELLMQWISTCHAPIEIDGEIGNLSDDLPGGAPLCRYTRFNVRLEQAWLKEHLGHDLTPAQISKLSRMDKPTVVEDLIAIARESADRTVTIEALTI